MIKSSKVFASVMLSLSMIVGNLPAMPLLMLTVAPTVNFLLTRSQFVHGRRYHE